MYDTTKITDRRRTFIFMNILVSTIASSMLSTAMTTALPPIAADLSISVTTGQWLTSGYSLAMGIIMPLTAFLIRRLPTKKLYLGGISIFIAGLVISLFSNTFSVMMAGRVLQACGNGILMSISQVVILSIYPVEKKGTVMGWYGLACGAAPVIAPTLAGILVDVINWKAIFGLALAVMLLSLIIAWFVFDDVLETYKKKFDTLSFILSVFAFGGVTLGIGNISAYGLTSPLVFIPLITGIITSVLFTYRQLHIEEPFLELGILKSTEYALSVIGSMLLYFIMMGSSVIMPLYVQSIMGYSATVSGLVTLPGSLAMAIVSPLTGKIFDKLGMKKLFICGAAFLIISNLGMYFITLHTSIIIAASYNVIRCIAIGCLMMPLITWGTSYVRNTQVADATALLTSLRTIAGAVGSAVFVSIMTVIADNSVPQYGENAGIHGLNITFLCMSAGAAILLGIAVFLVKAGSDTEQSGQAHFNSPASHS